MSQAIQLDAAGTYRGRVIRFSAWRRSINALMQLIGVWRERGRQRHELTSLVRDGFNFADLGITRSLAAREATRYPWQQPDNQWRDATTARTPTTARATREIAH
jgi:uncharacterized protein YjiS (DUF1127 family)